MPSTDGVEIALHDLGGRGPTLVLCHATGFHGQVWAPVADALADRFSCVALDFRGHGASVVPDDLRYGWSGMADDLLATVDEVAGGDPVRCAGWSMGGAAIVLAELRRPGTVSAAWLFEPIVFPPRETDEPTPLAEGARRRREHFDSRDEAYARYEGKGPFARADPRSLRAYVDHGFVDDPAGGVVLACRGETEAQVFESSDNGAFDQLHRYQVPTVVVASGDDEGPAALAPMVATMAPGAALERMPELTHFGPLEDPDQVAASIAPAVG